jgi:hypothetical protein
MIWVSYSKLESRTNKEFQRISKIMTAGTMIYSLKNGSRSTLELLLLTAKLQSTQKASISGLISSLSTLIKSQANFT